MRKRNPLFWLPVLCLSVVLIFVTQMAAAESKTPEDLAQAIDEGIKMLEAKDYKAFIERFIPPAELKEVIAQNGLDELAKNFGNAKAGMLLQALKDIQTMSPELSEDGQKASFAVEPRSVIFKKIEGKWRIGN